MSLVVGENTYVTAAEADTYAAARPALIAWAGLSDAAKEAAITEAAIYLDTSYEWKGGIADLAQSLAWPRLDVEDREGREVTGVPAAIKNAQIELAVMASTGALVESRTTGNVASVKAGSVAVQFVNGQNASEGERFAWIDRLLIGLFETRAGTGSANAKLIRG